MTARHIWCSVIGVAALSLAAIVAAAPATAGTAALQHLQMINYRPTPALGSRAMASRSTGLPIFTSTQTDGAKTFREIERKGKRILA